MSFERTKGSITNLSGGNISADDLLDMLVCVTRDVYDENKVTNVAALQVNDQSVLLKKMYNLIKMILVIYDGNKEGVIQFSERIRNEYSQSVESLAMYDSILAGIMDDISREEQKRSELQAVLADVEARRGHLLTVKEECDAIQQRIDQLNDTALDEMAAKKVTMEAELSQRTARAEELAAEQAQLQSELEALEERLTALTASLEAVREQHEALKEEEASATEEKARLEESIETGRVQPEEATQRIGDLPAISERINTEYQEIQMQMTVMLNALNSAKSDAFLTENLYALPGSSNAFTVENYPDLAIAGKKINNWNELEAWFAELEERIDGLLEVLRTMLAVLVEKAESITAQKDPE